MTGPSSRSRCSSPPRRRWARPSRTRRAWIGVKATDVGASLEGIDGLVLSVTGGTFSYNRASGAHDDNGATAGGTITDASALTWATALGTAPVGRDADDRSRGELLSLAGTATIDVFGFFTGQFIFTVDTSTVRRRSVRAAASTADRGAADDAVAGVEART